MDGESDYTFTFIVCLLLPTSFLTHFVSFQYLGIAYAYYNSYLSVYRNDWCNYHSVQLHEIGHNLNFRHSGEGNDKYDDRTRSKDVL